MRIFISDPSENERSLVDKIFYGLATKSYEWTKSQIMNIPSISNFDRINFYFFSKYATSIIDAIDVFEDQMKEELRSTCISIKKYKGHEYE